MDTTNDCAYYSSLTRSFLISTQALVRTSLFIAF